MIHLIFPTTNNAIEYEALIIGLSIAKEVRAERLVIHSNSQLVANHIKGNFFVKQPQMIKYLTKVKQLLQEMEGDKGEQTLEQIPRVNNIEVDTLAKISALDAQPLKGIFKEILWHPSMGEQQVLISYAGENWMTLVIKISV